MNNNISLKNTVSLRFVMLFICLVLFSVSYPIASSAEKEVEPGNFFRFSPDNLFAVEFVNPKVGFIAGYSGTFLRTRDGGKNWEAFYIGRNELIRRLSFVDENTGWAVGHRGTIFHTEDAGQTWEIQKELTGIYIRDVDFFDHDNGWVVGHDGHIWNTIDGGSTWQQQYLLGFQGRDAPRLHGVYAKDARTAILVGEFGVVGHTENGGDTWLVTPIKSKTTWMSIKGSVDDIYVVGLDGNIIRLLIATEEQRAEVVQRLAKEAAKKEKRARAKAKRLKREYVKKEVKSLPVSEIDYHAEVVDANTKEHLLDVAITANGKAVVVGRSIVLKVDGSTATQLKTDPEFPLPYVWFGGVAVTSDGTIWAPGIRGLVVSGNLNDMTYEPVFNLATSANVKLISNRWGGK